MKICRLHVSTDRKSRADLLSKITSGFSRFNYRTACHVQIRTSLQLVLIGDRGLRQYVNKNDGKTNSVSCENVRLAVIFFLPSLFPNRNTSLPYFTTKK